MFSGGGGKSIATPLYFSFTTFAFTCIAFTKKTIYREEDKLLLG